MRMAREACITRANRSSGSVWLMCSPCDIINSPKPIRKTGIEQLMSIQRLGVGRTRGSSGCPKVGSVATVIGLMPKQRETGFFGSIPRKATGAAQQIDFRFNSQTNKVCHLAHYIGVSARCFPVISDQTYTFLAQHGS